jgi:RimJ/RimL family protein N-acetyltransferase
MQHTTLSDRTRLQWYGVREAGRGDACSQPPRPTPTDYPGLISIPHGLAFQTRDGLAYTLRRVTPADAGLLDDFLRRLSPKTRWLRFMTARPYSPEAMRAEVARMVAGSAGNSITLIVTEACDGSEAVAAVAELVYTREGGAGEVGVVVLDDAQRKGIGSMLLRQLLQIAQELGLTHLHGDMLAENYAIQRCIKALQLSYTATIQSGEMHIIVLVPEQADCVADARRTAR